MKITIECNDSDKPVVEYKQRKGSWNPRGLYFPEFAEPREYPWIYTGFLESTFDIFYKTTLADEVMYSLVSEHKEIRSVDAYPEGFTCWYRER